MIQHTDHFHGSDLEKIEAAFDLNRDQITSFSANVNPLGISPLLRKTLCERIDAITTYPDREYTNLRKCIADYAGCDYNHILVGNGSTELISLLMKVEMPKKALIVAPTYSEYEHEIKLGGGNSFYYPLDPSNDFKLDLQDLYQHLDQSVDLLVLCNPNNPTSSAVTKKEVKEILEICRQHQILLMIDETYVEFAENSEEITSVSLANEYNNLIILRGISKFFAAPGLRLGYAITGNTHLQKEMNALQNPWAINSLAEVAGQIMFTDYDYIKKTKELIFSERERIIKILSGIKGIKVYQPVANFVLIKILDNNLTSKQIFERAIRRSLMIRDCSTFPYLDDSFIRFCFMMPEKNDALIACMKEALENTVEHVE